MGSPAVVKTSELVERLRRHYLKPGDTPGGVFVPEVGVNGAWRSSDGRSGGRLRRCDALHVGFTTTSGRVLTGHEVKVSRSDWLHELASPGKADAWADQCHAWYVVAPTCSIVKPEELPPGWGLMTMESGTTTRLAVKVKATVNLDHDPAWWAVRSLLARNDTLMWQTITDRAEQLAESRRAQRDREDAAIRAASAGQRDALADRLAGLVHELRRDHLYATDEDVVSAVRGLIENRDAAQQLQRLVEAHVRALQSFADPLRQTYGKLAELAATIRKDTA